MKYKKKINKILNYVLVIIVIFNIITFGLDKLAKTSNFSRTYRSTLCAESLVNKSNKSVKLLDGKLNIKYFKYTRGGNFPVFYNQKSPIVSKTYYGDSIREGDRGVAVFIVKSSNEMTINYNGKNININNKMKNIKGYLPTVYTSLIPNFISLEAEYLYISTYIPVFPLHNDVYALFGLVEKKSDDKFSNDVDLSRHPTLGIYQASGVAKYALVNLTSDEPAKMINVDISSYKVIDRKKSKLEKKLDKANIKYECCYEVGDTYQIVFKDIENNQLRKFIKKEETDDAINISIKKKDIDKFIKYYTGGDH